LPLLTRNRPFSAACSRPLARRSARQHSRGQRESQGLSGSSGTVGHRQIESHGS
jgi:hypothetical protein